MLSTTPLQCRWRGHCDGILDVKQQNDYLGFGAFAVDSWEQSENRLELHQSLGQIEQTVLLFIQTKILRDENMIGFD